MKKEYGVKPPDKKKKSKDTNLVCSKCGPSE